MTDRTAELSRRIEKIMHERGADYKIVSTEYAGHATKLAAETAAEGKPLRVYACGGDGTLNETLNGVVGHSNVELTQYPCGTGNDFVKLFGSMMSRFFSIEELVGGESMEFDLIECLGKYSINICSTGFDARIAGDVHKFSKIPGVKPYAAFSISVLYNMFRGLHKEYKVTLDGEKCDGRYTMLVAANARYYGGGYNPTPDADPTDGLLDFLLVKKVTRFQVAKLIKKYSAGKIDEISNFVRHVRGKEMIIDCGGEESYTNIDGEVAKSSNITMKLSEQKIRFFAPLGSFAEWK